jgi:hypothetical protein
VSGSVSIVRGAVNKLKNSSVELLPEDEADLVKKLMLVTCSDKGSATPILEI